MDNPPNQPDLLPIPSRIDFEVPCPRCEYNLRGLTVPRCPECGLTFEWNEVPEFKKAADNKPDANLKIAVIVALLLFSIPMTFTFPSFFIVVILYCILFFSAIQAGMELGFASLVLGYPTWKRFRAWWEGVLIGYGLCSLIMVIWGYYFDFLSLGSLIIPRRRLWPVYLTTALASLLVQWWVVRRRMRQWNEPISDRKLWLGCLLAKTIAAAVWIAIPFAYSRV